MTPVLRLLVLIAVALPGWTQAGGLPAARIAGIEKAVTEALSATENE